MRLFADRHYEAHLEAEVRRLQTENRALMNSILGLAGAPEVKDGTPKAEPPQPLRRRRNWRQIGHDMTNKTRAEIRKVLHGGDLNGEHTAQTAQR